MSQSDARKNGGRGTAEMAAATRAKERRKRNIPVAKERRNQKVAVAKPAPNEELTADQIEFMKAMDQYKRDNRRPFPTWSEVLEVLRALGYRKVSAAVELPRYGSPPVSPKG